MTPLQMTPCGFCFVEYFTRKGTEDCVKYLNGTTLDEREIRIDFDWGFQNGRQYGRGKTGGQVRDEYRTDFDLGRGGYGKLVAQVCPPRRHSSSFGGSWVELMGPPAPPRRSPAPAAPCCRLPRIERQSHGAPFRRLWRSCRAELLLRTEGPRASGGGIWRSWRRPRACRRRGSGHAAESTTSQSEREATFVCDLSSATKAPRRTTWLESAALSVMHKVVCDDRGAHSRLLTASMGRLLMTNAYHCCDDAWAKCGLGFSLSSS